MTHVELEGMMKVRSCSVKVIPWHFPTGTVYIQENVSRDRQSPGWDRCLRLFWEQC